MIVKNKEWGVDIDFTLLDLGSITKLRELIKKYEGIRTERLQREALENKEKECKESKNVENLMIVESNFEQNEIKNEEVNITQGVLQEKLMENTEEEKININNKNMHVDLDYTLQN